MLSNFYGKLLEKICLKAPGDYSASIWTYNFSICIWQNQTKSFLRLRDFRTRHPAPKPTIFTFADTRIPKQNPETKQRTIFKQALFSSASKMVETSNMSNIEKTRAGKWWRSASTNLQNHGYEINVYRNTWNGNLVTCDKYLLEIYKTLRSQETKHQKDKTENWTP